MPIIKKFNFTLDQVSDVQFDPEKKVLTFTFGDEKQEVPIMPVEDPSRLESIEFSDNQLLSLSDIAKAFSLPEIVTAAGASSSTSGLSQYDDNAGNLIDGIDRLGMLEPLRSASNVEYRNFLFNDGNDNNENINDGNNGGNNGGNNNNAYSVFFHPETTEVFESHLANGTHVVHGNVEDQDDRYTKATGTFEITGEGDYKGEVTFIIGNESVTIDLPSVGESITTKIGEDSYTITHENDGTYSYEYTLLAAKDHSVAPTDDHGDKYIDTHIHVTLTDPTTNTVICSGDTAINIINDGVTAIDPDTIHLTESQHYVSIALDVSNSMNWSAKWGEHVPSGETRGETRYQVAVKALIALMEEYKEISPDTQVNLFLFNYNVKSINAHTPQEVIDFLTTYQHPFGGKDGGTNYGKVLDEMLDTVKEGVTHSDYTNQVIFISDGEPNSGMEKSNKWQDFVNGDDAKNLDIFSVGIGNEITEKAEHYLKDVCNSDEGFVTVENLDDLKETLHDVMNVVSGNLAAENVLGADGVDSFYGFVDESGTEHKIDWTEDTSIDKDGYYHIYLAGDENSTDYTLLKINSHGDYILQVHGAVQNTNYNNIHLILEDTDGDQLTLTGKIEIHSSSGDNSKSESSLALSVSEAHEAGIVTDETHHLAVSDNHNSDTVTTNTHSLAASDSHTSNIATDAAQSLVASYDHIFDAVTNEVDIFNFAKHGQNSGADHVNIFTLDSGSNLINNFTLGEDKISFEDILSEDEPLTLSSIISHIDDGSLLVEAINEHSSEIIIAFDGHEPTTIDINFDSNIYRSVDPSLEEQALLLLKLAHG